MIKFEREVEGLETVGELMEVLAGVPDEMPLSDALGEPLIVRFYKDIDTDDPSIEIG